MNVAVTGAAGFLGRNLVRHLAQQGHSVTAIDRRLGESDLVGDVRWIRADILDGDAMGAAVADAEIVYHLAGRVSLRQRDPATWQLNTDGVSVVARACLAAGVRRMVHCSSVHAFDEHRCGGTLAEHSPRSESPTLPVYDRSKWAGERVLQAAVARGLDAVICNPTGVYGPVDDPHRPSRINAFALTGARGRSPVSVAGGFDLVDVRDVAVGLTLAADRGRVGHNYLLAGTMVTMHQLSRTAAQAAGRRGPAVVVPLPILRAVMPLVGPIAAAAGSDAVSRSSVRHLQAAPTVDGRKAQRELGFRPRPFAETVRDLVAHGVRTGALSPRRPHRVEANR